MGVREPGSTSPTTGRYTAMGSPSTRASSSASPRRTPRRPRVPRLRRARRPPPERHNRRLRPDRTREGALGEDFLGAHEALGLGDRDLHRPRNHRRRGDPRQVFIDRPHHASLLVGPAVQNGQQPLNRRCFGRPTLTRPAGGAGAPRRAKTSRLRHTGDPAVTAPVRDGRRASRAGPGRSRRGRAQSRRRLSGIRRGCPGHGAYRGGRRRGRALRRR